MAHSSRSILIIDDNERLIANYEKFFADEGFAVSTALTGAAGLDKAKSAHPEIILLDLMLPEMNGIEVLKNLKADDDTKDIPVIVLTALVNELEKDNSLSHGAVEYVEKLDLEPEQLLTKIKHTLKAHHA